MYMHVWVMYVELATCLFCIFRVNCTTGAMESNLVEDRVVIELRFQSNSITSEDIFSYQVSIMCDCITADSKATPNPYRRRPS